MLDFWRGAEYRWGYEEASFPPPYLVPGLQWFRRALFLHGLPVRQGGEDTGCGIALLLSGRQAPG